MARRSFFVTLPSLEDGTCQRFSGMWVVEPEQVRFYGKTQPELKISLQDRGITSVCCSGDGFLLIWCTNQTILIITVTSSSLTTDTIPSVPPAVFMRCCGNILCVVDRSFQTSFYSVKEKRNVDGLRHKIGKLWASKPAITALASDPSDGSFILMSASGSISRITCVEGSVTQNRITETKLPPLSSSELFAEHEVVSVLIRECIQTKVCLYQVARQKWYEHKYNGIIRAVRIHMGRLVAIRTEPDGTDVLFQQEMMQSSPPTIAKALPEGAISYVPFGDKSFMGLYRDCVRVHSPSRFDEVIDEALFLYDVHIPDDNDYNSVFDVVKTTIQRHGFVKCSLEDISQDFFEFPQRGDEVPAGEPRELGKRMRHFAELFVVGAAILQILIESANPDEDRAGFENFKAQFLVVDWKACGFWMMHKLCAREVTPADKKMLDLYQEKFRTINESNALPNDSELWLQILQRELRWCQETRERLHNPRSTAANNSATTCRIVLEELFNIRRWDKTKLTKIWGEFLSASH